MDELIDHHDHRLTRDGQELKTASAPPTSRARGAWTSRNRDLTDLDLINQMLAVGETEAHLDLLVARGQAQAYLDNDIKLYRLPASPA